MITKDIKTFSTNTSYLRGFSKAVSVLTIHSDVEQDNEEIEANYSVLEYNKNKTEHHKVIYQIFQSKLKQAIQDEELTTVSAASDQQFIEFLNTQPHLKTPAFFVNSFDNIELTWRNVDKEAVDLQFLGDGQVQFVIFSKRFGDKMTRVSGRDSDARVKDMVDFYGLQDLVYEPITLSVI